MSTPPAIHSVSSELSGTAGKSPLRRSADTVARIALLAAVLFGDLFAGFLTAVLVLEASLRRFPASVWRPVWPYSKQSSATPGPRSNTSCSHPPLPRRG
jgi:hypothetical protein